MFFGASGDVRSFSKQQNFIVDFVTFLTRQLKSALNQNNETFITLARQLKSKQIDLSTFFWHVWFKVSMNYYVYPTVHGSS